jgi:DNA-binding NarL/FixJ family response regulator
MDIRIVIVEDDKEILQTLSSFVMQENDFTLVKVFADAESFIADFMKIQADVVIMDIGLPGQSGIQAVARLKPRRQHVQFIMCTVFDDDERIFDSLCAGATGYLVKNTSHDELKKAIVEVYNGGSPMSAIIARKVVRSFQARNSNADVLDLLTSQQWKILKLLDSGFRYKEIAEKLGLSIESIRTYVRNIYEVLQVHSRTDAVNKAFPKK